MSGPVCPACGVTVMPGYARCPKCKAPLPYGGATQGVSAGGTAVEDKSFPVLPVAGVVVVVGALIAFFALRGGDKKADPKLVAPVPVLPASVQGQPGSQVIPTTPIETEAIKPTGPSAESLANQLRAQLSKQRLWSDVEVNGARLEIRSGACEEPAMPATLDAAGPGLKTTGLTKIRCLDKSGRLVFERDL